jgi:hypothetical protein
MKKLLTIFIMFALLAGTVSKEIYSFKILKTTMLSDSSDQDDKDGDKDDSKDKTEKEPLTVSFLHEHDLSLAPVADLSSYSFFISHETDISSPYLESISQPPEHTV